MKRVVVALTVLVVSFGFVLPRLGDYGGAWRAITAMTTAELVVLAAVASWNLFTYWPVLVLAQPGLRLREAAVVNQATTAVANTVPAGSAVAIGATFRILRAWGFTTESVTTQVVVTGTWNQLVKLVLPLVAILVLAVSGEVEGELLRAGVWGGAACAASVLIGARLLRSEETTAQVGAHLDRSAQRLLQLVHRPRPTAIAAWLLQVRCQLVVLLHTRALPLSIAVVVSHLSLYAVLLTALRAVGITAEQLGWPTVLAGFALVRLLSAIPVTPGGLGVVEIGYVGLLVQGAASGLEDEITAAVLLFRAVTYLVPVLLGGIAWLVFDRVERWRHPPGVRGHTTPVEPSVREVLA